MSLNYRWFQLVASLIPMIMIANLQYAWMLFVQPLQAGTGWRLSDLQFAFTLFILFQTWVQPLDGCGSIGLGRADSSVTPGCSAVWDGRAWDTPPRCRCSLRPVLCCWNWRGSRI